MKSINLKTIWPFLWMTGFFHCLAHVWNKCMSICFPICRVNYWLYTFFLVRLNMISGLNPHMNVNRGIASPNPFGRGRGVSGRSLVFLLNEPSITELNFALKTPIYRVPKILERWEGREGMVCVYSVGYRSPTKLLGSIEWERPFTLLTSNLSNGHLRFDEWTCIIRKFGGDSPTPACYISECIVLYTKL